MESTSAVAVVPASWHADAVPDVDDVRPKRCENCGKPARRGGRILLHGHGVRVRSVIVPPAVGRLLARVVDCWVRRYRCVLCRHVVTVVPGGVMPRYLYSVGAIVVAFFLVTPAPVGEGLDDEEAYARQGMLEKTKCWEAEPYRWRSIDRWVECARRWWHDCDGDDVSRLIVGFLERAGTQALGSIVEVAVGAHARCGSVM